MEHGHRYGGGRETHDHGRGNIGRQRLDDVLRNAHDIRFGPAHVDSVLEINIGDAAAEVGVAMDVLDAFHRRGQEAFEQIGDAPFHLLRQQAGVDPDHGGDGNRDIREDVGRHVEHRLGAQQHDKDGHDDEGVRPSQGNEDNLAFMREVCQKRFDYPSCGHRSSSILLVRNAMTSPLERSQPGRT